MNLVSWLADADRKVFYFVNTKLSIRSLDNVMLLLRQAYTWIPLYLFFLLFFYANCRKYLVPVIALSVITFAFTDFTSASILKPLIGRLRPCHDESLKLINNISACGGLFSMPSSHAANHFGLATFWFNVIQKTLDRKWYWLFIWAFAICYSQVYVGVHYPGDVTIGALLGFVIASFTTYLFSDWMNKINNRDITNAL
jgi:undecaprenyl-diphosphatase